MKTILTYCFLLCISLSIYAQQENPSKEDLEKLDFWVGYWNVTWTGGAGTNRIEKRLGDRVIQENFSITEGSEKGFEGTSISTFGNDGKWHQTWADNQGGYYIFVGIMDEEDSKIFQTVESLTLPNGNTYIFRMKFHDIASDRFIWDWERSADDGKSWDLRWRINYERVK